MANLIVKMMTNDGLPDDHPHKPYNLQTGVKAVQFLRKSPSTLAGPAALLTFDDGDEPVIFVCEGNVYVMNENGKTISSWGPSSDSFIFYNLNRVHFEEGEIKVSELRERIGVPSEYGLLRFCADGELAMDWVFADQKIDIKDGDHFFYGSGSAVRLRHANESVADYFERRKTELNAELKVDGTITAGTLSSATLSSINSSIAISGTLPKIQICVYLNRKPVIIDFRGYSGAELHEKFNTVGMALEHYQGDDNTGSWSSVLLDREYFPGSGMFYRTASAREHASG